MKALVNSILVAVVVIAMNGCAEETALNEPLRFSFKINSPDNGVINDLPPESALLVSMETPAGETIYDLKEIAFHAENGIFSTSALDVQPGEYKITEFMVVDNEGQVLYTIPDAGAPLSNQVKAPLGSTVLISSASTGTVAAEALEVKRFKPSDFGLTSFLVRNAFQLLISEEGSSQPLDASAVVLQNGDTVATFNVPGKKSRISFSGDLTAKYKLIVSRDAYAPYEAEFTLKEWAAQYKTKPLNIRLAPAFTMVGSTYADEHTPFYFYIGGEDMNISVNWGDGTTDTYHINDRYGIEIAHFYQQMGSYRITVTGDIKKIVHFYSFYGGSEFSSISFRHLTNLKELLFGLTSCPSTIDLSYNKKLEQAMMPGLRDMAQLILPETHSLTFLEIDGENQLDTDDVNGIIQNIYTNTSAANRRDGILGLRGSWYQEEGDLTMVGPPSSESLSLLESLRNDYGWIVNP
jgi:hypothetical protein